MVNKVEFTIIVSAHAKKTALEREKCLCKADYRSLNFVVNRMLMKLFKTSNIEIIDSCRYYFNFLLPSEILPIRTRKFMEKNYV